MTSAITNVLTTSVPFALKVVPKTGTQQTALTPQATLPALQEEVNAFSPSPVTSLLAPAVNSVLLTASQGTASVEAGHKVFATHTASKAYAYQQAAKGALDLKA